MPPTLNSAMTSARPTSSSREAKALATSTPCASRWFGDCDELNPKAPAAIASRRSEVIASISPASASRRLPSSPIT